MESKIKLLIIIYISDTKNIVNIIINDGFSSSFNGLILFPFEYCRDVLLLFGLNQD